MMIKRLLSWAVLAAFLYVMLQSESEKKPLPTAEPAQVTSTKDSSETPQMSVKEETEFSKVTDIDRWKRAINPDYAAIFKCALEAPADAPPHILWKVTEDKPGKGSGASCADTISVKLTVWNAGGKAAYAAHVGLQLGTRAVAAGLDAALVGIRPGGVRTVILGPEALGRDSEKMLPKPLADALGKDRVIIVTVEREQ